MRFPAYWSGFRLVIGLVMAGTGSPLSARQLDFDAAGIFEEVWSAVDQDFVDPDFHGVDWAAIREQFRPRATMAASRDEFAAVVNEMLATLKTSHTAYLSVNDPRRYQLIGIFEFLAGDDRLDLLEYEGIGIDTASIDGKDFVVSVFDGSTAAAAGILFGDEIMSVDGKPFLGIDSFRGKTGQSAAVKLRRDSSADPIDAMVTVETLNGRTMFGKALDSSVRVYEQGGRSIGYVHVWCYAGSKYHEQLKQHVLWGDLSHCDALIVDLRDGWGGASLEYLNLFRQSTVEIQSRMRNGTAMNYSGVWGKPVALLVNGRSTSGKELFTFGFKKLGLGPVIGERTAGAVVGGRPTLLANGDVLYLAVADLLADGERLEGRGVEPTVAVDRPVPYAAGADPQLEKAIEQLAAGS